jgi:adenine phosphoribosyltransferase
VEEPSRAPEIAAARGHLLRRFRWLDGHADVWRVFEDGAALASVIRGLAAPWEESGVTAVAGVESRGFLLGGAVATHLGVGFHAVRKAGALLPGTRSTVQAGADYRGNAHALSIRATLGPEDRVLFVDDWAERGAQADAVRRLVLGMGAQWLGASLMVDQLTASARSLLGPVTCLVTADELDSPSGIAPDMQRPLMPNGDEVAASSHSAETGYIEAADAAAAMNAAPPDGGETR